MTRDSTTETQNADSWNTTTVAEPNSAFDTINLIDALLNDDAATLTAPTDELHAAAAARAKEHDWVPKTAFDYEAFGSDVKTTDTDANQVPWLSDAEKYEWQEEFGDVGPRNETLEAQLFAAETIVRPGDQLTELMDYTITQEGPIQIKPIRKFEDAGLHPVMLANVKLMGYKTPTPVQAYCLPAVLKGHDVIACAQTGSGKTAAYLIPILSKLMGKAKKLCAARPNPVTFNPETDKVTAQPLVLIVCPSRELATQIFDEARRLCYRSMLRPCVIYGGAPSAIQKWELAKGCDVLIATPGRLLDFMEQLRVLSLARVKYTVIDEADEMLQPEWEDDMKKIMSGGDMNQDADHHYMMFSATFPKEARQLAKEYMDEDHVRIRVGRAGSTHGYISQRFIYCEASQKRQALYDLLFSMPPTRTIIFVNSVHEADAIDDYLYNLELPCTSIHSHRTQREREDAIRAFKVGTCPILVATGVSARGLDVKNVWHIINYDMPNVAYGGIQEYVHRIGRTARIGNTGMATSFMTDRDEEIGEDLVKLLLETKQDIPPFLEHHMPEGGNVVWDDDSDAEDDMNGDGGETAAPATTPGSGNSTAHAEEPGHTGLGDASAPAPEKRPTTKGVSFALAGTSKDAWDFSTDDSMDKPAGSWSNVPAIGKAQDVVFY